ncbi:MAG: GntR family transcriptional regulator [Hyphomicrobiales bacterium]|nr:GntR family transcriptional regulator [Hyphomicrobiales bacterium]
MPVEANAAVEIDPRLPIGAQVYAVLKRMILSLALEPNEALSEKELALRLGVSRTPVREALIRLADEDLVEVLPQRGTFVSPILTADVLEAQFLRESLEAAVVRRAAENPSAKLLSEMATLLEKQHEAANAGRSVDYLQLDEAFHRAISDGVAMPRAWRLIHSVKGQMDRVRFLSLPNKAHMLLLTTQHAAIFDAVEARDPDRAEAGMRHHLREVLKSIQTLTDEMPTIFA